MFFFFFFFNDTATTEIYTLSLHDALPISKTIWSSWMCARRKTTPKATSQAPSTFPGKNGRACRDRSEEHTSELQSLTNLVCRLLLEKKKKKKKKKRMIKNKRLKYDMINIT